MTRTTARDLKIEKPRPDFWGAKGSRRGQAGDRPIDAQQASSELYHLVGGDSPRFRGTPTEKASYLN
jgi:hypothetical protein